MDKQKPLKETLLDKIKMYPKNKAFEINELLPELEWKSYGVSERRAVGKEIKKQSELANSDFRLCKATDKEHNVGLPASFRGEETSTTTDNHHWYIKD